MKNENDYLVPAFSGLASFTSELGEPTASSFFHASETTDFFLRTAKDAVYRLARFEANWDGFGSVKPDSVAIQRAVVLLRTLHRNAQTTRTAWVDPHVSASEAGEVTFEWWKDSLKLTLYVGPTSIQFIRVWGTDMENEMADGDLQGDMFEWLWSWLHGLRN
jgi:hypothetical protein